MMKNDGWNLVIRFWKGRCNEEKVEDNDTRFGALPVVEEGGEKYERTNKKKLEKTF